MNFLNKLTRKNELLIGGIALLLLGLPIVIISLSQQTNNQSQASGEASIELENGVVSGSVTTVADANASGGNYIRLGTVGSGAVSPTTPPTSGGSSTCQPVAKSDGGTWQCTFSDEFNGTTLSSTWEEIPYGLGDSCLWNDAEHVKVVNGNLQLIATKNSTTNDCYRQWGLGYTGGGIQSQGQFAQKYGRFEMRAKLPPGDGFWPAFWLLPGDDSYDGEIDILESYGGRVEQGGDVGDFTLHVPAAGPGPQKTCRIRPDYSSDYHTYTFEWKQGNMKTYYDGVLCADFNGVGEPNGTNPPAFPATFNKPYHILLNLAVQPWWPPTASTPMPGTMYVDYVRVWQ